MGIQEKTRRIKQEAISLGFSECGIVNPHQLNNEARHLKDWLSNNRHAGMQYMANHFEKRIDPKKLFPEVKSIVVVLLNYFPKQIQSEENNFILSKYAYGQDYHRIIKSRLRNLQAFIDKDIQCIDARAYVDSAPVLERAWAACAGLGWIGKNTNLISPKHGSFIFIGELFVDIELEYDNQVIRDHCGNCNKCIEACPTKAIRSSRIIDSNRCLSYLTIEHREPLPDKMIGKFRNRIFGCDICQDVCPWNRKIKAHNTEELDPPPELLKMTRKDWKEISEDRFLKLFRKSAVKRAKYSGLKRNIEFVEKKRSDNTG